MRRIVSLAGHSAQFAVADDGTCWFWNGAGWEPARGPLPQPMVANDVAAPRVVMATITTGEVTPDPSQRTTARDILERQKAKKKP